MDIRSQALTSEHIRPASPAATRPDWLSRVARKAVLGKFDAISVGTLVVEEDDSTHTFGGDTDADIGTVTVRVRHCHFFVDLAFGGSIGAAEAYMRGDWDCDDLTRLVRLFSRNRSALETLDGGLGQLMEPINNLVHRLHRNTVAGSRRNIAAHYDLSNELFQLFLDPTMMYSAAVFERDDMTLHEASVAKIDRICRKLQLGAGDHLLEIGTGWGGFAIHAAANYGCRVTTTTISKEQYDLACERIHDAGLSDRIQVLLDDYRDLTGQYDKLVSIEMIEAVGHHYYDEYFRTCSRLLKPDGSMVIQAITIDDRQYAAAIKSVDFIQRYIFPGSNIPSLARMAEALRDSTDMKLFHLEDNTEHYARTLQLWNEAFQSRLKDVRGLGFSEEFIRMWEFYFCYCEGGFREHVIGSVQMLFTKPEARRDPLLGSLASRP
jgi:cyclopropane-fatty-acyl-phospholipid synthase